MAKTGAQKTKEYRERRYAEIELMPKIPCACGCGTMIAPLNRALKPARLARNHHLKGNKSRKGMVAWNKGQKMPPETIEKRTITRYARYGDNYGAAIGFKRSPEQRKQISERQKQMVGEKNPFFGKKHTEESRRKNSEKHSGENNSNWNGGTANLPYGPEFNRKFKRLIRERDKYTCQRCGITQKEYGRTLQIHHLDHDKFNNDPSNLVVACGKCNMWASYHRDEPFVTLP